MRLRHYAGWWDFYNHEPWGYHVENWRAGVRCPSLEKKKPVQSAREQKHLLKGLIASHGKITG